MQFVIAIPIRWDEFFRTIDAILEPTWTGRQQWSLAKMSCRKSWTQEFPGPYIYLTELDFSAAEHINVHIQTPTKASTSLFF